MASGLAGPKVFCVKVLSLSRNHPALPKIGLSRPQPLLVHIGEKKSHPPSLLLPSAPTDIAFLVRWHAAQRWAQGIYLGHEGRQRRRQHTRGATAGAR
ncbi:hypothetical protein SETIT_4G148900v2 [Setaria italica]|uniref:Uncharacterized protein n=1 Tax=Setaria italica TaxID=4555 RepID=A0A368QUB3_SETIT|nr:hypothetical protein SETIT_4G148900v2 [Setaria italica]